MSDDSLLGKADQLMRRHRTFVAGGAAQPAKSAPEDEANDDLPLLTEVIVTAADAENALQLRLAPLLAEQRRLLLREFERWLDENLAQVVGNVMDGVSDRLVALISKRAHSELLPRLEALAAEAGAKAASGAKPPVEPV